MSRYFFFYLIHTTIPNYNRVTRILAHTLTLGEKFKSFCVVNQKVQEFFVVVVFPIPRHKKGKPGGGANRARIGAYHVVQNLLS